MPGLVLDTHATIWYLEGSPTLSATVLSTIRTALNTGDPVYVSSVTIVELTYLVEKGRFPTALLEWPPQLNGSIGHSSASRC